MLWDNLGATPFGMKNIVQITDAGGYAEKGPVKTEEGSYMDFLSGRALEAMEKVNEEANKRREENLAQQEQLRQSFRDLETQIGTERQNLQDELQQSVSAIKETAAETPAEPVPETPADPVPETPAEPVPETPAEPVSETAEENTAAAANEAAAQAAAAMAAEDAALEGDTPPAVPEDL